MNARDPCAGIALGWGMAAAMLVAMSAAADDLAYRPIRGASPEPLASAGPVSREELAGFLDGVMATQLRNKPAAGAVVAVVKDGEVFLARGYGYEDVEKQVAADPAESLFRPGSISKLVTWTAVMQQVEQGKLD